MFKVQFLLEEEVISNSGIACVMCNDLAAIFKVGAQLCEEFSH